MITLKLDGMILQPADAESRYRLGEVGFPDGVLGEGKTVLELLRRLAPLNEPVTFPDEWLSDSQYYAGIHHNAIVTYIKDMPLEHCLIILAFNGVTPKADEDARLLLWLAIGAGLIEPPIVVEER